MLGELVPAGGGDPIPLRKSRLLIGRRDSCDITLAYANVSSKHCELEFLGGFWQVRDLGSSNGTKVNGKRVDTKFLQPGDELGVGKHYFKIAYQPNAEAPPPPKGDGEKARLRVGDPNVLPVEKGKLTLPSLMELAGLEHRPEPPPPKPKKAAPANPQEDEAMKWLQDDPAADDAD